MSLEVRELILRAKIVGNDRNSQNTDDSTNQQQLIAACVAQVLEILERERER
ncbi:MAG: DUF5908 family protein [Cyanobacteria bacterium P01_G01_bin.54]